MSATTVAFFNNKGGVGKTSLVYHLAWTFAEMDVPVLAADFDPQANLTASFLDDERVEALWEPSSGRRTIQGAIEPIVRGVGDVAPAHVEYFGDSLGLLPGDLALSGFEDQLSEVWPKCLTPEERAFRATTAMWRVLQEAANRLDANLILIDVGPNLGALNRAALVASDYVVVPLAADLFSLQGLKNLGPTLHRWRHEWSLRKAADPGYDFDLPAGGMQPAGYVVMQHSIRHDRPARAYQTWIKRIPHVYREDLIHEPYDESITVENDPHALALIKHYRTLMALAHEARKPIFHLTSADGASGSHFTAAKRAGDDFRALARAIRQRIQPS